MSSGILKFNLSQNTQIRCSILINLVFRSYSSVHVNIHTNNNRGDRTEQYGLMMENYSKFLKRSFYVVSKWVKCSIFVSASILNLIFKYSDSAVKRFTKYKTYKIYRCRNCWKAISMTFQVLFSHNRYLMATQQCIMWPNRKKLTLFYLGPLLPEKIRQEYLPLTRQ